eukprot:symbB.v1.2.035083.t1/scaffold4648.1/size53790/2
MEVGHMARFGMDDNPGLEIHNSRISRASIEARPFSAFSDGDRGQMRRLVDEAMRMEQAQETETDVTEWLQKVLKQRRQRNDKRSKAGKLKGNMTEVGGDVHLETVRLLRRAAQMSRKTKVSPAALAAANLLQAHHVTNLSIRGQAGVQPPSEVERILKELVNQEEETWADRLANRATTARARYAATKAQLMALEGADPLPVRSASKKEALKRYRAHTASPMRSQSELAHFRSLSRGRSKLGLRDLKEEAMKKAATEAAAQARRDARKEITRLKVMSLHHDARRRMMQSNFSSDEEDEVGAGHSIMELAAASRNMRDFKGPSERVVSQTLSNPNINVMSGPGFFEESCSDEKVAQVAAKWLGDRSDTQPSLMIDPSEGQTAIAVEPVAHSAFRPFRNRSKVQRKPKTGAASRRHSSASGSTSESSDSHGYRGSSRSTSRRGGSAHSQRGENVHFRNVSYFIDLMDENDHRKRSKKQSKRRRKARERQRKQATRADFRWNSHMLKLMELQLDNPRPRAQPHQAHQAPAGHIHGHFHSSGSDDDRGSPSPRFLQARTPRRRDRTPRKKTDPEGPAELQMTQVRQGLA